VPYGKSTPISDWLTAHKVNSLAVAQEWEMEAGVVIFAFKSAEDASKFLEEWTEQDWG
jgi:hypothetical protein